MQSDPPAFLCDELIDIAHKAGEEGEVPIAAGLYRITDTNWQTICLAVNQTISMKNPLAHAEILVIDKARQLLQTEYLTELRLVTTLEPCLHCTGAIVLSRINAVHFFAPSAKGIRLSDIMSLSLTNKKNQTDGGFANHHPSVFTVDSYQQKAKQLLEDFFAKRRL